MDDLNTPGGARGFNTRLSHLGRAGKRSAGFVNPPVSRGSTVLAPTVAARQDSRTHRAGRVLAYGLDGSTAHWALEDMIADVEGGYRTTLVGSGLSAVTTAMLAFLKAGDHCLIADSVYGPTRRFADETLTQYGVTTTYYDPHVDRAGLAALMRPNTSVVFTESPGSHTFEVQDISAIAAAAHAGGPPGGAKVLMDNTWGIHHFQPFRHGVDVSIQAVTKYPVGHSDVLIGAITVGNEEDWTRLHAMRRNLGQFAGPDDVWLTLRGMRTMGVRLARQQASATEVAAWLATRPEIVSVLYPPLPGAPGHELWKRDFTGGCSLFGVVFHERFSVEASHHFCDTLDLFGIGSSWGGYESLAIPTSDSITRVVTRLAQKGPRVRLHVGLEDPADLIADLAQALDKMAAFDKAAG